jgi:hypothetical protein
MLSKRRRWLLAAGMLLGTTTNGTVRAQDSTPRPAVLPPPANSTPLPAKPAPGAAPTAGVNASKAELLAAPTTATTPAPPVSADTCTMSPDTPPWYSGMKPSFWSHSCYAMQDCFLGFRSEFGAPPLGYYVYLHGRTEVANGDAARMVLYHYDFVEGGDELNPRGHYQLEKIAALLPQNFNPVIIEATPCAPGLDEARRIAVARALACGPFPVPAERVVVGRPIATPLQGMEAVIIYRNLLLNTESGGLRGGGGGASTGLGQTGTTNSGILAPTPTAPR